MTGTFEVGQSYATRSLGDWDCIYSFTILERTAKQVTTIVNGKIVKRGITTLDGVETFKPFGTYSMCAVIYAEDRARELAALAAAS